MPDFGIFQAITAGGSATSAVLAFMVWRHEHRISSLEKAETERLKAEVQELRMRVNQT